MGAVDELQPHQGVLGVKEVGIDLVQLVPADIVVAVAGGPGKVALRDPMPLKGGEYLLGIRLRNGVDAVKVIPHLCLRLAGQRQNTCANL